MKRKVTRFFLVFLIVTLVPTFSFVPFVGGSPDSETLRPNAVGTYQAWDLSDSTHYGATNDTNDSTYIYTGVDEERDTQNLQPSTFDESATINWVTVNVRLWSTGSGQPEEAAIMLRSGGSDWEDTEFGLATARGTWYDYATAQLTQDPTDSQDWTKTKIDALEAGARLKQIGGGEEVRCAEIWVVVDYTAVSAQEYSYKFEETVSLVGTSLTNKALFKSFSDTTQPLASLSSGKEMLLSFSDSVTSTGWQATWLELFKTFSATINPLGSFNIGKGISLSFTESLQPIDVLYFLGKESIFSFSDAVSITTSHEMSIELLKVFSSIIDELSQMIATKELGFLEMEYTHLDNVSVLDSLIYNKELLFLSTELVNVISDFLTSKELFLFFPETINALSEMVSNKELFFSSVASLNAISQLMFGKELGFTHLEMLNPTVDFVSNKEVLLSFSNVIQFLQSMSTMLGDPTSNDLVGDAPFAGLPLIFLIPYKILQVPLQQLFGFITHGKTYYTFTANLENPNEDAISTTLSYTVFKPTPYENVIVSSFSEVFELEGYENVTKYYTVELPIENGVGSTTYTILLNIVYTNPYTSETIVESNTLEVTVRGTYFVLRLVVILVLVALVVGVVIVLYKAYPRTEYEEWEMRMGIEVD